MTELPKAPPVRILRSSEAACWIDGYAFLRAARVQAMQLEEQTQQTVEQARAEGFAQGLADGQQQAARLLAKTAAQVDAYLAGMEQAVAELAMQIAHRILTPLDTPALLLGCTRKAMSAFRADQLLTLHVAPGDLASMQAQLGDLSDRVRLEADPMLSCRSARLSSPMASVDLALEAQLDSIRQALMGKPESTL